MIDFSRYHTGYVTVPPTPPLRAWAKNPGQPAALFEVEGRSIAAAIADVKREGFERAFVEVK